nr:polysaccharide deacetylase family protein [Desulfobulbaceae bacterium]
MISETNPKAPWSLAEKIGLATIIFSALVFAAAPQLAILSLAFFLILCAVSPFLHRFSFFLPVISHGQSGVSGVAITFDDGPSPASTPDLLKLLAKYNLKATFFVIGEKAAAYPQLIRDILTQGHSVANHSYRHDSLLMFKSYRDLKNDIQTTQSILEGIGVRPHLFRSPAGITNPRLKAVLAEIGLTMVNFSCRIFDYGNKRIDGLAAKVLARIRPGDILMLHDTCPDQNERKNYWLTEIDRLFADLQKKNTILPLEDVIKMPVMSLLPNNDTQYVQTVSSR